MKKIIFILIAAVIFIPAVYSQESVVVYVEGWVDVKDSNGDVYELFIGDMVRYGDTVITGDDGVAELEPQTGSRIVVKPGTVFSVRQADVNGKKQSVLSTTIGQVSFKFDRLTQEPLITTPSTVMGVRGTEFSVWAGADGASLVDVESGSVEVSGRGESVLLGRKQAVQTDSGRAPGQVIESMGKATDHSDWNENRVKKMMASPIESLEAISSQLAELEARATEWKSGELKYSAEAEQLKQKRSELFAAGKDDEARALDKEQLRPAEISALRCVMNYRYYALSALSLRQYILGGFYVRMKTSYINKLDDPLFVDFSSRYDNIIADFNAEIAPLLVEADY